MINPQKMIRFNDKAKMMGNKFYQNVHTYESYEAKCKKMDADGYNLVFGTNNEEEEEDENDLDSNINDCLEDEILDEPQDVIKKYQFHYDATVLMTDKYPEISVSLAPGENQRPQSILMDQEWDIMAFPALHNADGSNGKDQERKIPLTAQRYFIQRVTNINSRFAKCPSYLYAVVGYLEQMQINRNINLVGTRGKKTISQDGKSKYQLHDPFRALEAMQNTPKFWQKSKFEILSKIDNFGAFQFFYTLSCADLRWSPNFAAILLQMGYDMRYDVKMIDGRWQQVIEGKSSNGDWKPITKFIEEDVNKSHHELIRGNVVQATRFFDNRVKCFLRDIVMKKSNPMSPQFYTYKVEFQARGAGRDN